MADERNPRKPIGIGIQDFEKIRERNSFYVDKTHFIREWWESTDDVTLITRPRRFGKTLLMNTVERFLSNQYQGQASLFMGLKIWEDEKYRKLQGTVPVIAISFADVKQQTYESAVGRIAGEIFRLYNNFDFLLTSGSMNEAEIASYNRRRSILGQNSIEAAAGNDSILRMTDAIVTSLQNLSMHLHRHYGQKVVILMDEYDTPMQEAYVHGYWEETVGLFRPFFNATFKTNPSMERALMTGITRVSRESMFSDLNNLEVVTATSELYADAMGFTEAEVFAALDVYGYSADREAVKHWYDGFTFGSTPNIYNPWSILNYLKEGKLKPYWANTSSNSLAGKLIREGDPDLKQDFEDLLQGKSVHSRIDEQVVFGEMQDDPDSVWSLLLAAGYLKVIRRDGEMYELALTNHEVREMFSGLVRRWFAQGGRTYNHFAKALLTGDLRAMNHYMNQLALTTFSSFDTGNHPSGAQPERFYHGVVLGLLVELEDRYVLTSNRESGFGRYDVMLQPRDIAKDDGYILEFKVIDPYDERSLEDTVAAALRQIEQKQYAQSLVSLGIPEDRIHRYGFAFEGKQVLIG